MTENDNENEYKILYTRCIERGEIGRLGAYYNNTRQQHRVGTYNERSPVIVHKCTPTFE